MVPGRKVHEHVLDLFNIVTVNIKRRSENTITCLVVGVGNTLLQDDGIGIHVANSLRDDSRTPPHYEVIDGGTIGLALLPDVEDADTLVIVDAADIGEAPGTVRVFLDEEVDEHLSGKRRSVHEVAVVDLLSAASIRGARPRHCALVAVQPESIDWGLELSPDVQAAIPVACDAIHTLSRNWRHET
jgi:hydrogenase maturation protease